MSDQTTHVVTGLVRFSYAHVFEPKANLQGKEKYSVAVLIPKTDKATIKKVKAAIKLAYEQGKASKFGGKDVPKWKNPLRDGDEERPEDEAYAGHLFFNANSNRKPSVVDANVQPIIDPDAFYSGCYGRASVNFYAFNEQGNKGVAAGLNNVQKLREGERLAGGTTAEQDFADLDNSEFIGDDDDLL